MRRAIGASFGTQDLVDHLAAQAFRPKSLPIMCLQALASEQYPPLKIGNIVGTPVAAAVGKFSGTTPEEMLAEITRHSRFTAEEFQVLATEQPVDVPGLHRRIRSMIEDAESFVAKLPSDAVGVVFLDGGRPVQPDVNALGRYQRNSGAPAGVWPTSPDIGRAMLERYGKPRP